MQASWTLYAGGCNFKGNFFCWVFSVTRGFGELIFTVSVVGGGSGGGSGRKEELLFLAALPCGYLSPFVPWNYGEGGKLDGFVHSPNPEPLEACWALLKPPKQMVVDQSFKDPRIDILQPPLLTDVSA